MPTTLTQPKQATRMLKYQFSETELEEMASTVFENISSVQDLKAEKKSSNKAFNKRIDSLETTNVEYGHLIQEGFEHRDIAVEITFNKPKDGIKTIVRMDDHTAWEEEMEVHENTIDNLPLPGNDEEE